LAERRTRTQDETRIAKQVAVEASARGARVFRNNVGVVIRRDGKPMRFGLCPGSSDLIGWRSVEITPDMVGERIAQFVAIEVKTPTGRVKRNQTNFLKRVNEAGGLGFIARSPEDVEDKL